MKVVEPKPNIIGYIVFQAIKFLITLYNRLNMLTDSKQQLPLALNIALSLDSIIRQNRRRNIQLCQIFNYS